MLVYPLCFITFVMSLLQSEQKCYLLIRIMSFELDLDCSLLSHSFEMCYCVVIELDFANDFHSLKLFVKLIFERHSFESVLKNVGTFLLTLAIFPTVCVKHTFD